MKKKLIKNVFCLFSTLFIVCTLSSCNNVLDAISVPKDIYGIYVNDSSEKDSYILEINKEKTIFTINSNLKEYEKSKTDYLSFKEVKSMIDDELDAKYSLNYAYVLYKETRSSIEHIFWILDDDTFNYTFEYNLDKTLLTLRK